MTKKFVLDTSTLLAWRDNEAGTHIIDEVLERSSLNTVNLGELNYKLTEFGDDPQAFVADIRALGVQIVDFTSEDAALFPLLKERDAAARKRQRDTGTPGRKTGRLSLGDICCLATAINQKAEVITGDMYWTEIDIPILIMTYKDA
ncbi:MAG: PIN domain-containing protein [Mycobacteriales bacterium]